MVSDTSEPQNKKESLGVVAPPLLPFTIQRPILASNISSKLSLINDSKAMNNIGIQVKSLEIDMSELSFFTKNKLSVIHGSTKSDGTLKPTDQTEQIGQTAITSVDNKLKDNLEQTNILSSLPINLPLISLLNDKAIKQFQERTNSNIYQSTDIIAKQNNEKDIKLTTSNYNDMIQSKQGTGDL